MALLNDAISTYNVPYAEFKWFTELIEQVFAVAVDDQRYNIMQESGSAIPVCLRQKAVSV